MVPRRLDELINESRASDVLEANRHRLIGSQAKPGELLSMCNALPFMDDYRLIIVEGLLGTAEPTRPLYNSYAVFCLKKKIIYG